MEKPAGVVLAKDDLSLGKTLYNGQMSDFFKLIAPKALESQGVLIQIHSLSQAACNRYACTHACL
jgi:hypothetical protein